MRMARNLGIGLHVTRVPPEQLQGFKRSERSGLSPKNQTTLHYGRDTHCGKTTKHLAARIPLDKNLTKTPPGGCAADLTMPNILDI